MIVKELTISIIPLGATINNLCRRRTFLPRTWTIPFSCGDEQSCLVLPAGR